MGNSGVSIFHCTGRVQNGYGTDGYRTDTGGESIFSPLTRRVNMDTRGYRGWILVGDAHSFVLGRGNMMYIFRRKGTGFTSMMDYLPIRDRAIILIASC